MASKLPNHLREWRESVGISQETLADRIGTGKTQISRLETGQRRLTVVWLERIAKGLGRPKAALLAPPPGQGGNQPSSQGESMDRELVADVLRLLVKTSGAKTIAQMALNMEEEPPVQIPPRVGRKTS